MRELLQKEDMPLPDEVEYGFGCIRLFFHEPKAVIVVDIDDYTEVDEAMRERAQGVDPDEPPDPEDQGRGPPFTLFPDPGSTAHN